MLANWDGIGCFEICFIRGRKLFTRIGNYFPSFRLRPIEQVEIFCVRKLFDEMITTSKVRYNDVCQYDSLFKNDEGYVKGRKG